MAHLFGPVARVACIGRRRAVAVDIDDVTVGLLDFACGITASLTTLFACPLTSHLRLSGTAAVIEATDDFATLRRRPMAGSEEITSFAGVDTVAVELAAFAAAIRGEAAFPVTPAEAVHNVAVMEAMVRSAADAGAWIEVEA
jgi:predicted dehydrogenase